VLDLTAGLHVPDGKHFVTTKGNHLSFVRMDSETPKFTVEVTSHVDDRFGCVSFDLDDLTTTGSHKKSGVLLLTDTDRQRSHRDEANCLQVDSSLFLEGCALDSPVDDKSIAGSRQETVCLSIEAVDSLGVSFGALGDSATVPCEQVTTVTSSKESVSNEGLAEDTLRRLSAPSGSLLALELTVGEGVELDFLDTGGDDLVR